MDWRIERFETLPSTNELAVARIRAGSAAAGDVIVAGAQTRGHGRRGRVWADAPGALLMTAVLPTPEQHRQWTGLAAAVAVAAALRGQEVPADLKWPNDVILLDRKVAGILVEVPTGSLAAV